MGCGVVGSFCLGIVRGGGYRSSPWPSEEGFDTVQQISMIPRSCLGLCKVPQKEVISGNAS